MTPVPFSNEASYRRFLAIADKIEADPALLQIPLANITRWLAMDRLAPRRLLQWRSLILAAQASESAFMDLLLLLRVDTEEARHLKSFSPFPGVLSSKERQNLILETCSFRH